MRHLLALLDEHAVTGVVVGLPLAPDGSEGDAAREARVLAADVARHARRPVDLWDGRLTTARALRAVRELGGSTRGRKDDVDALAAAVVLQHYLDPRRGSPPRRDGRPRPARRAARLVSRRRAGSRARPGSRPTRGRALRGRLSLPHDLPRAPAHPRARSRAADDARVRGAVATGVAGPARLAAPLAPRARDAGVDHRSGSALRPRPALRVGRLSQPLDAGHEARSRPHPGPSPRPAPPPARARGIAAACAGVTPPMPMTGTPAGARWARRANPSGPSGDPASGLLSVA